MPMATRCRPSTSIIAPASPISVGSYMRPRNSRKEIQVQRDGQGSLLPFWPLLQAKPAGEVGSEHANVKCRPRSSRVYLHVHACNDTLHLSCLTYLAIGHLASLVQSNIAHHKSKQRYTQQQYITQNHRCIHQATRNCTSSKVNFIV
jgi:hypothetical protein